MTPTDTPLTPEKKKRIQPAYKGLFEEATKRVSLLTWLAVIGWILFSLTATGFVCDFVLNHLKP